MKNLIDLFASGCLRNKADKPIVLKLIPLEVENNKQYVSHLKKILDYNINSQSKGTKQKIIQAKSFLKDSEDDIWNKYLVEDSGEQFNDKEEKKIISWSPIYQPKKKTKSQKQKPLMNEIINAWHLYTITRREIMREFKEKRRKNIMKALIFELRIK